MCNKRLFSSIITAAFCLLVQLPSYAGVYKWVDDSGQVHYSEQPGNNDAEKVNIRTNETTQPRAVDQSKVDLVDADRDKKKKKQEEAKEQEKINRDKRKWCNEAKQDLAEISSRGRLREMDDNTGQYVNLTEEEKQKRISAAKKKKQQFCN